MGKPILVLDFDGVLHSYTSGWKGATVISDPPTPGMVPFLRKAVDAFDVQILSSRSKEPGGIEAMKKWLYHEIEYYYDCVFHIGSQRDFDSAQEIIVSLKFPTEKPAAFLTIDDRALTFTGVWPDIATLLEFQPWNKRTQSNGSIAGVSRSAGRTQLIRKALTLMRQAVDGRHAK